MQDKPQKSGSSSTKTIEAEAGLRAEYTFLAKDFVETANGYAFAVVSNGIEEDRVLTWLRYQRQGDGWRKLSTSEAATLMQSEMPEWQFNSSRYDAMLHGIPVDSIAHHYRPSDVLGILKDTIELQTVLKVLSPIGSHVGVTGSRLIGAEHNDSDIDLVIYGRENFFVAQHLLQAAVSNRQFDDLNAEAWRIAYERRGCSLSLEQYVWHERRKANKFRVGDTKVDISMSCTPHPVSERPGVKLRRERRVLRVTNDDYAFASPAVYGVDSAAVSHILVCTPTYAGQARVGEWVEAIGWIEVMPCGSQRLVVGSSRESPDEVLRVIQPK